jgi:alkylation response protein AidB-like acyl-CoA dehydrogenase
VREVTLSSLRGDDSFLHICLYSRAQSVMGGTSQIQKNIIATRILELPQR